MAILGTSRAAAGLRPKGGALWVWDTFNKRCLEGTSRAAAGLRPKGGALWVWDTFNKRCLEGTSRAAAGLRPKGGARLVRDTFIKRRLERTSRAAGGRRWRWAQGVALGLLLLLHAGAARALDEYAVKAAFLFNFAKFIEWPEAMDGEKGSFALGILGEDPFGKALVEVVSGKALNGLAVQVYRGRTVTELKGSDVVFLAASEEKNIERHLKELAGRPVLTVSDVAGFARRGGMIELYVEGNRVRFAINVKAMRDAGLEPSSKLLALAQIVDG